MDYLVRAREYDTYRDIGNQSIFRYVLNDDLPARSKPDVDFLARNPSLNVSTDGYGTSSPAVVDTESMLKLDSTQTHTRSKITLSPREHQANPASFYATSTTSEHGSGDEWRDPRSWQALAGESTSRKTETTTMTPDERSFEAYTRTPFVPMMHAFVCNDVPLDHLAIGQSSKDIYQNYVASQQKYVASQQKYVASQQKCAATTNQNDKKEM